MREIPGEVHCASTAARSNFGGPDRSLVAKHFLYWFGEACVPVNRTPIAKFTARLRSRALISHVDALLVDIILNQEMQAGIELAKRAVEMKPALRVVYSTGLTVTDHVRALLGPGAVILEKCCTILTP